ncbi:MAG: L-histidine N(alpha)-methyltransferase, partial [Actinomycetota bacterium]
EPERATLRALDLEIELEAGEELRVEISTKFREEHLREELTDAGFDDHEFFKDDAGDFALVLARRA